MELRAITQNKLDRMISEHEDWLKDNNKGSQLVLIGYDLVDLNLKTKDLRYSNFSKSKLVSCDFRYSNLSHVDFSNCIIHESTMDTTDLSNAKFDYSNIDSSSLRGVKLINTSLIRATIHNTDLTGSVFKNTDIRDAIIGRFVNIDLDQVLKKDGLVK